MSLSAIFCDGVSGGHLEKLPEIRIRDWITTKKLIDSSIIGNLVYITPSFNEIGWLLLQYVRHAQTRTESKTYNLPNLVFGGNKQLMIFPSLSLFLSPTIPPCPFPSPRKWTRNLAVSDNAFSIITRGQSNLTKSASRGAHSPVRGHPRGSKFVLLNSCGRVSY